MTALQLVEVLLLAGCLLLLGWLVALWVRRRTIGATGPVALCAVRRPGTTRWRLGLIRLGGDDLGWFTVSGVTSRPNLVWRRAGLEISTPRPETVDVAGLERPVSIVLSNDGGHLCDLALERQVYFALRSWLESAPPGRGVNVA